MSIESINFIKESIRELEYRIDLMRSMGADEDLIDLLSRVISIGSISIFYQTSLKDAEVSPVKITLDLALKITKSSEENMQTDFGTLLAITERMETLYREKHWLLSSEKKALVA